MNRPAKRNAFRPETVAQLIEKKEDARDNQRVGVMPPDRRGAPHRREVRLLLRRGEVLGSVPATLAWRQPQLLSRLH